MAENKKNPAGNPGNPAGNAGNPAGNTNQNDKGGFMASLGSMAAAAAGATGDTSTEYEVQKGDSLSAIGKRFGVPWRDIYEANRDQIKDPDLIHPGWKLKIPNKKG